MKNTKTVAKKKLSKPKSAKSTTKKVAKKSAKPKLKAQTKKTKKTQQVKAQIKQKIQTTPKTKTKIATPVRAATKPEKTVTIKKNPNGMNHFQQCMVLAAFINQKRHQDDQFQTIPLPEITSSLLAPLREYLSQYAFTSDEIQNGLDNLVQYQPYAKIFPVKNKHTTLELAIHGNPKKIMGQLIELAGPEARKIIFLKEENNRFLIHRTTLEKYALKTGQVEGHVTHHDSPSYMSHESTHRDILNQINQRTNPKYFGQDRTSNFSTKQRRGRG